MSQITQFTEAVTLPLLPLRDVVVFPHMVIPLFVGRPKSIKALETAMDSGKHIMLVAQKSAAKDEPAFEDLYEIGAIASILQMLKLPDGTVKVLVEGNQRVQVSEFIDEGSHFMARGEPLPETGAEDSEIEAMRRALLAQFDNYVKLNKKIPPEILASLAGIDDAGRLTDTIAAHLPLKLEQKQAILEMADLKARLDHLMGFMETEIDILQVEKRIRGRVKRQMEKSQREYYLNEQVKAIQKELGDVDESQDLDELDKRIRAAHMSKEATKKAEAELKKLKMMSPMSAEATVVRTYIETLINLPWKKKTKISKSLDNAQDVLDTDHYGLEKVKERIVEYLAVRKLKEKMKGPILCFVGPPGVGKTSLGKSIARALGREFVRISLGGVRDEAEIRGHRRTYVGALPGRIIQGMKQAGTNNPVFMLDEVDKVGMDFRGDPSAALLEVLDPEQNSTFTDHYLGVPFDLTEVMFVTTANLMDPILPALRDRMEVIDIPGYTEEEKLGIAQKYLIPRQMNEHGITEKHIRVSETAIRHVISHYTREAGVRNLEREVANLMRKVAKKVAEGKAECHAIDQTNLNKYLGVAKFIPEAELEKDEIGVATGLAWTESGGDVLYIEATVMKGKGQLTLTGHLGDVMKESAQAALSYVRSREKTLGISPDLFAKNDIHIHVPAGATPKDGPSAGITMATAIASALAQIPVRRDLAMTGEITLRGRVLPIGGLKEKILAAKRAKLSTVALPKRNKKDLEEIPKHILKGIELIFVDTVDDVIKAALRRAPSRKATAGAPKTPLKKPSPVTASKRKAAASPRRRRALTGTTRSLSL